MSDIDIYQKYIKYKKKYFDLVKERLKKSLYPTQSNDFFFLTIPKRHPNAGREIPVDYKLRNIVLYFWDVGLVTVGWDQGFEIFNCFSPCFINFNNKDINNNETLPILKKIIIEKMGEDNVVVKNINTIWTSEEDAIKGSDENEKFINDFFSKNPYTIMIEVGYDTIGLVFRQIIISEFDKKLNIKMPDKEKRCPGGLIQP